MRKVSAFVFVTLNGFFKGPDGDISWHRHGAEENGFAVDSMKSGNMLLFGRLTYEMMAGYWPTPLALKNDPVIAAGINNADKVVFSRTLKKADWQNTRLIKEDAVDAVKKMKRMSGKDMTILGSGSILAQFADHGLIDEYEIMVDPVVLGDGMPIMKGVKHKLDLELKGTKTFKSGVVLLSYRPVEKA